MDNVRTFNSAGNLIEIKNANNQTITITYTDGGKKLSRITDGTGHTLDFTYYDNTDFIKTIKDNANRTVQLVTSGSKLNGIIYPDTNIKTYIGYETQYLNNTDLIDYVWSVDGTGLRFDYKILKEKHPGVSAVREIAATDNNFTGYTEGQLVTFDRSKYNTTVIRSAGIDGIHKEQSTSNQYDDIVTTLQFDNSGRPISQQVSYNGTTEVGSGAYNYTSTTNTSDSKNKIADAASLGKNTVNMLVNGGCEGTTGWTQNKPSNLNSALYEITGTQYAGGKALAINNGTTMSVQANTNYGQVVNGVTAGKTYTFSAFVRTADIVKTTYASAVGYSGAYLQITARNSNGANIDSVYSQVLTTDTDTSVNGGWRRITATYELPAGTTNVAVYMCLRNAAGKAYFDNAQLETGSTPNSVNLLQNSSFEKLNSDNSPANWVKNGTSTSDVSTTAKYKDGARSLLINGNVNAEKSYSQTIDVQGNPADTYIVSGWAAAYAVSSNYHNHYTNKGEKLDDDDALKILGNTNEDDDKDIEVVEDSKFEIDVSVIYKDENGNTKTQHKASAKFNTSINDWQYSSAPIVLKYVYDKYSSDDDGKTYTPVQLKVSLVYTNQANHAYFDHVQLVKDVAQSYTYDDEGNVVSVSANAEQKNDMSYDPESNNLKSYTDAGGNTTTFDYEENTHNLTKVTSPKGVKTQYTYNSVGLNTATEIVNTAGNAKIKTTTAHPGKYETDEYTISAGAYVRYSNDQHGYTTTYGYDMPTGTRTSVTSPNGLVTSSSYDSKFTKLLGVSAQDTSVKYTYDNNRLSQISFGYGSNNIFNETYNFLYDVYGNVTETRVGSQKLSTNHYLPYNGGLDETVYGNNDGIKYGYNYSGNVTAIYYKDNVNGENEADYNLNTPAFTWQYSSNGTPRVHKDGYTGLRYDYGYDAIGRLIRTDISKSSNGAAVGSTEYGYNTRGHLTSITNDIGGNAYGQYFSYSQTDIEGSLANATDGLPTRYRALGVNTDYAYDSLNRLTKRNVDLATDIETLYTYKDSALRGTGYTTTQLATEKLGGISYGYNYDNMGNITSIVKGSNEYRSYLYDDLGQLTQERNVSSSTMTSFSYNHLGNIVEKHINDYNGINEKAKVRYGYSADSNAGWNYLLTSITTEDYTSGTTVTTTETIDYDAIGNPITYRGAAMAWRGRQLTGHTKNGVTSTFSYDADGLRSSKTVGNVKSEYQYVGDQLFYEKRGDSQEFYYFYDSYGNLSKIYYTFHNLNNNTTSRAVYHALTNAQGDVVALYNSSGSLVAQYEYDAWGNTLSIKDASGAAITAWYNIAVANPIRYRGYYYDADLGLYYLQSRYYDSGVGRFINADDSKYIDASGTVLGGNLFAYCENNPVMYYDPSGGLVMATAIKIVVVVLFVSLLIVALAALGSNEDNVEVELDPIYEIMDENFPGWENEVEEKTGRRHHYEKLWIKQ